MRERDWDPRAVEVTRDQRGCLDALRSRCPVAYSDELQWSVFRHADVVRVAEDHETFSNVVSAHHNVPNGMDPPEHGVYRAAIEVFFADEHLGAFEPACREIASRLLAPLARQPMFDCVEQFAVPFAARCQCAFLGWPEPIAERLQQWTARNQSATRERDRQALAEVARELTEMVGALLEARRASTDLCDDVTGTLMRTEVYGRRLEDVELTSIFRNWTMGEVGSLAASVGIIAHALALDSTLQSRLRDDQTLIASAIDEILRVRGPLLFNRRVAKRDVVVGRRRIAAGERVALMWSAANRDDAVFDAADEIRLDRDQQSSLLWGTGIHVCPGAPLARLELRVAVEALLAALPRITLVEDAATDEPYPGNGFAELRLAGAPASDQRATLSLHEEGDQ
ncbi:MAG: cytochrome P450 [Myxococcales bacterium]|nr:cytochrome P450 [Myxococcales bacterium]